MQTGLDRDSASFLLSIIGISNTVSRIVLGYISDRPCVNRLWVYNVALTISGIGRSARVQSSQIQSGPDLVCFSRLDHAVANPV